MKPKTVTLGEYARVVGKSRATVSTWVAREGLPVQRRHGGRRGAHVIDLAAGVQWALARAEAQADERLARVDPAAAAARLRKLSAEADLVEVAVRQRQGQLVDLGGAEQRYARLVGATRERLLTLAGVLVSRGLIAADHEGDVARLVHDALAELAARGGPAGREHVAVSSNGTVAL